MTTFNPLHPLQSGILEALAAEPGVDMQTLQKRLRKASVDVSLPNLYRTVGLMTEAQMLVRDKGKLSLNMVWVPHLLSFVEQVKTSYGGSRHRLPGKDGERVEFKADTLAGLDPIWFHLLLECLAESETKEWYAYNAHPWHVLGMMDTELRGYKSMAKAGITTHMLYGNDTFLDTYANGLVKIPRFKTHINRNVLLPKEGYALWICDEYVFECLFPDAVSKRFAYFFDSVTSIKQFNPQLFEDIFHMKAACKLTVRKSKKDADKMRNMLKRFQ